MQQSLITKSMISRVVKNPRAIVKIEVLALNEQLARQIEISHVRGIPERANVVGWCRSGALSGYGAFVLVEQTMTDAPDDKEPHFVIYTCDHLLAGEWQSIVKNHRQLFVL